MLIFHKMSLSPSFPPAPVSAAPSAKFLDKWFNGNSTNVNICPRPKEMIAFSTTQRVERLFR